MVGYQLRNPCKRREVCVPDVSENVQRAVLPSPGSAHYTFSSVLHVRGRPCPCMRSHYLSAPRESPPAAFGFRSGARFLPCDFGRCAPSYPEPFYRMESIELPTCSSGAHWHEPRIFIAFVLLHVKKFK